MNTKTAKRRIRCARILCGLAAGAGLLMAIYTYMAVRPTGFRELEQRVEARAQARREGVKRLRPPMIRAESPQAAPRDPVEHHGQVDWGWDDVQFHLGPPYYWVYQHWSSGRLARVSPELPSPEPQDMPGQALLGLRRRQASLPGLMANLPQDVNLHELYAGTEQFYTGVCENDGWHRPMHSYGNDSEPIPYWDAHISRFLALVLKVAAEGRHDTARALLFRFLDATYFDERSSRDALEAPLLLVTVTLHHLLEWGVVSTDEFGELADGIFAAVPEISLLEAHENDAVRRTTLKLDKIRSAESVGEGAFLQHFLGGVPHVVLYHLLLPLAEKEVEDIGVAEALLDFDGSRASVSRLRTYGEMMSLKQEVVADLRADTMFYVRGENHLAATIREAMSLGGSPLNPQTASRLYVDFVLNGSSAVDGLGTLEGRTPRTTVTLHHAPPGKIAVTRPDAFEDWIWLLKHSYGRGSWPSAPDELSGAPPGVLERLRLEAVPGVTILLIEHWTPMWMTSMGWNFVMAKAGEDGVASGEAIRRHMADLRASADEVYGAGAVYIPDVPTPAEFLRLIGLSQDDGAPSDE